MSQFFGLEDKKFNTRLSEIGQVARRRLTFGGTQRVLQRFRGIKAQNCDKVIGRIALRR